MTPEKFVASLTDEQVLALLDILKEEGAVKSDIYEICEYAAELRGLT